MNCLVYLGSRDEWENSERAAFGTDDDPLPCGWYLRTDTGYELIREDKP